MHWRNSPFFRSQFDARMKGSPDRTKPLKEQRACSPQVVAPTPLIQEVFKSKDDSALQVLADWLEEAGDSRCEYIRRQCQLAAPLASALEWAAARPAGEAVVTSRELGGGSALILCQRSTSLDWHELLREILQQYEGAALIVVDLRQVRFIGASVLDRLVRAYRSSHRAGGDLCVYIGENETMREIFRLVRLDTLFHCDPVPQTATK